MNKKKRRGLTWALVVIAAVIIALGTTLALPASSQGFFGDGRGFGSGRGPMMFAHRMPFMALGGLCLLGLAGLGLLVILGAAHRHGHGTQLEGWHQGALELLRKEFAEGKIGEDVYRSRLAVLKE